MTPRSTRTRILGRAGVGIALLALLALGAALATSAGRNQLWGLMTRLRGRATVEERTNAIADSVKAEVRALCADAGLDYPPSELVLIAIKDARTLEVYGRSVAHARGDGPPISTPAPTTAATPGATPTDHWRRIASWPILAASGGPGPKLREGDGQVPEGVYPIESLHPNSRYHLALRVGYPNAFDRDRAREEGRDALGGDIMIHGGALSIGCLAIGDPAIERLFLLVAATGVDRTTLVIAPTDLRTAPAPTVDGGPAWLSDLYGTVRAAHERIAPSPR